MARIVSELSHEFLLCLFCVLLLQLSREARAQGEGFRSSFHYKIKSSDNISSSCNVEHSLTLTARSWRDYLTVDKLLLAVERGTKQAKKWKGRRVGGVETWTASTTLILFPWFAFTLLFFFGGSIKASCHSSTLNSTILYATALGEAIDGPRELCFSFSVTQQLFWVVFGRRAFSLLFPSTSTFTAHHLFRSSGRGENKRNFFSAVSWIFMAEFWPVKFNAFVDLVFFVLS